MSGGAARVSDANDELSDDVFLPPDHEFKVSMRSPAKDFSRQKFCRQVLAKNYFLHINNHILLYMQRYLLTWI
jgi:hypothetical protein